MPGSLNYNISQTIKVQIDFWKKAVYRGMDNFFLPGSDHKYQGESFAWGNE